MSMVEGRIAEIVPTGSYNSDYGLVYTSELTIQGKHGVYVGEIGEKSPDTKYAVGQDIAVTVTGQPPNTRFKKYNPKFPDQQAARSTQQAPQRAVQGQKSSDSKDVHIERQNALRHADEKRKIYPEMTDEAYFAFAKDCAAWIATGKRPLPAPKHRPQPGVQKYQPNPDYEENPAPPDGEVPF